MQSVQRASLAGMDSASDRPESGPVPPVTVETSMPERWPVLKVSVPPTWKVWLDEAAAARALPVAALVRQLIRDLMVRRHDQEAGR